MVRHRTLPRSAIKVELPAITQRTSYTCGPAAVLSVCRYFGVGPTAERAIERDMKMSPAGSDPAQLRRVLVRYGLGHEEFRPMSDAQLRACLDDERPVILMLQAWAKPRPISYRDHWRDGHWVLAIGYTRTGVVFEDPWLDRARGFLRYRELDERWHDVEGRHDRRVHRYGLAVSGSVAGTRSARRRALTIR